MRQIVHDTDNIEVTCRTDDDLKHELYSELLHFLITNGVYMGPIHGEAINPQDAVELLIMFADEYFDFETKIK